MTITVQGRIRGLKADHPVTGIAVKYWNFPSGEPGVAIEDKFDKDIFSAIQIHAECYDSDSIMKLFLLLDALKEATDKYTEFHLVLPYIPFGRQDRYTDKGTSFSLKVFANMLNSFNLDGVLTFSPHSNVSKVLINNLQTCEPDLKFKEFFKDLKNPVLVAPDLGAEKRIHEYLKAFEKPVPIVVCLKDRDPTTGEIKGIKVPDVPEGADLIVVDDICDGGRTFIELAKYLPENRESLSLFVTHGIFSKGRDVLEEAGYDNVHCVFDFIEKSLW